MKRILCFGDSNTWGFDPRFGTRQPESIRWTGRLQHAMPQVQVIPEGENGRTTLWDDLMGGCRNGKEALLPCLQKHCPVDWVLLMLGINDCKTRLGLSAEKIAEGVKVLTEIVEHSECGPDGNAPKVLILCPPAMQYREDSGISWDFNEHTNEVSRELEPELEKVAVQLKCEFLDLNLFVQPGVVDGIHLDAKGHAKVAEALEEKLSKLL
ncbi:MAG: SGNH/GDSL hydrolase family protein [Clostridiales bacterium]|jgi:lysophospholipase L1-like esterase|nr:SGNH/GDSL hydrolase family protein [Clostridiales bacterium]MCI2192089.1 SGNH/GDSL hydrolase family protein [Oscillospiraceae bacterium]MCI1962022.1 SGNH/GDSL hydrolase family protein [Clostridiales bacterium]MCI2022245.1 SGNH/GDSL hydrolase family protein [Clostridiales bacterium]MCI2026642.1 SGNH/GDSL hydrolase family protein [Clostridiales bacterium]